MHFPFDLFIKRQYEIYVLIILTGEQAEDAEIGKLVIFSVHLV